MRNGVLIVILVMLGSPLAAQTMIANGTFDAGTSGWIPNDSLDRLDWIQDDGAPGSGNGCMEVADTLNNGASTGGYTVVQVSENTTYELSGWWRLPAGSAGVGACFWGYWFDPQGGFLGYGDSCCGWGGSSPTAWTELAGCSTTSPPGAGQFWLWAQVEMASSGTVESVARWDDIVMVPGPLFADGFESGDFGAWSSPP